MYQLPFLLDEGAPMAGDLLGERRQLRSEVEGAEIEFAELVLDVFASNENA